MTIFAFLVSGALAGLAGIGEVSGTVGKLDDKLSLGYGFAAIIVAFLGRLNPLGIIAAGLILALSYIGGEAAQISLGVSNKLRRGILRLQCSFLHLLPCLFQLFLAVHPVWYVIGVKVLTAGAVARRAGHIRYLSTGTVCCWAR